MAAGQKIYTLTCFIGRGIPSPKRDPVSMDDPRPRIVVSKCLGFDTCRYNGATIEDPFVEKLGTFVDYEPVCPEVAIGLGIPRDPVRIVTDKDRRYLFQPATELEFGRRMEEFADQYLSGLKQVDGFLLKNRSPSCGPHDVKIYRGFHKTASVFMGSGFFGGEVLVRFKGKPVEDEGRLKNFTIRENFLMRVFALARFRNVRKEPSIRGLVDFHTRNKYLLMAFNQSRMRELGRVVANHRDFGKSAEAVITRYGGDLEALLDRFPRLSSIINVLMHMFGGFKDVLKPGEKRFFLNSIEEYRDERIPLSVILHMLEAWAVGHDNQYLLEQTFLRPYPLDLVEITDSGKGRKF
jgi:uncharacterized protein YbgA (DUF1722 family)/uncharacterized protein YbbK (DUF523 family)